MRKSQIGFFVLLSAVIFTIAGCSHVGEDWKAAQTADTTEAYQDFLRQHPDSEYGVAAQERVRQLAEDRDWQQASKADTLDAYQQFVAVHADGKWAQEARVRIENFQLGAGGAGRTDRAGRRGCGQRPGRCPGPCGCRQRIEAEVEQRLQGRDPEQQRGGNREIRRPSTMRSWGRTAQRPAPNPPGTSSAPAFRRN